MYFVDGDFEFVDGDLVLYFVVDHLVDDDFFLHVHLDILNEVKP